MRYLLVAYRTVDRPAKAYKVLKMPFLVTSGGGRSGLTRNSGYVTMGGRSLAALSVVELCKADVVCVLPGSGVPFCTRAHGSATYSTARREINKQAGNSTNL